MSLEWHPFPVSPVDVNAVLVVSVAKNELVYVVGVYGAVANNGGGTQTLQVGVSYRSLGQMLIEGPKIAAASQCQFSVAQGLATHGVAVIDGEVGSAAMPDFIGYDDKVTITVGLPNDMQISSAFAIVDRRKVNG